MLRVAVGDGEAAGHQGGLVGVVGLARRAVPVLVHRLAVVAEDVGTDAKGVRLPPGQGIEFKDVSVRGLACEPRGGQFASRSGDEDVAGVEGIFLDGVVERQFDAVERVFLAAHRADAGDSQVTVKQQPWLKRLKLGRTVRPAHALPRRAT